VRLSQARTAAIVASGDTAGGAPSITDNTVNPASVAELTESRTPHKTFPLLNGVG
jgi:hypothetical protein